MFRNKALVLVACLFALVLTSGLATASDEVISFSADISPPKTKSFDISWVDNSTGLYFLGDRTNKAVDLVDATTDSFTGYIGQGVFSGGPNGVLHDLSVDVQRWSEPAQLPATGRRANCNALREKSSGLTFQSARNWFALEG